MKSEIEKAIDSLLSEYIAPGYVIWEPGVGYNNSGLYGQLIGSYLVAPEYSQLKNIFISTLKKQLG